MDAQIFQVAKKFCDEISQALTDEQIAEVVKRNAAEPSGNICHSHDFCDVNECMLAAIGGEFENSEKQNKLMNDAWNMAKGWGFKCPR